MNDWLDYKGSGSSRAYMGDTMQHGNANSKQEVADRRLYESLRDAEDKLIEEMRGYNKRIDDAKSKIHNHEVHISKIKLHKKELETKRSEMVKSKGALAAHQYYAKYIASQDDQIKEREAEIKAIKREIESIERARKINGVNQSKYRLAAAEILSKYNWEYQSHDARMNNKRT